MVGIIYEPHQLLTYGLVILEMLLYSNTWYKLQNVVFVKQLHFLLGITIIDYHLKYKICIYSNYKSSVAA